MYPPKKPAVDRLKLASNEREPDNDTHAVTLFNVGRNWEKNDRPELAIKSYRELVAKYPMSAGAKTAKERIKALGGPPMKGTKARKQRPSAARSTALRMQTRMGQAGSGSSAGTAETACHWS